MRMRSYARTADAIERALSGPVTGRRSNPKGCATAFLLITLLGTFLLITFFGVSWLVLVLLRLAPSPDDASLSARGAYVDTLRKSLPEYCCRVSAGAGSTLYISDVHWRYEIPHRRKPSFEHTPWVNRVLADEKHLCELGFTQVDFDSGLLTPDIYTSYLDCTSK